MWRKQKIRDILEMFHNMLDKLLADDEENDVASSVQTKESTIETVQLSAWSSPFKLPAETEELPADEPVKSVSSEIDAFLLLPLPETLPEGQKQDKQGRRLLSLSAHKKAQLKERLNIIKRLCGSWKVHANISATLNELIPQNLTLKEIQAKLRVVEAILKDIKARKYSFPAETNWTGLEQQAETLFWKLTELGSSKLPVTQPQLTPGPKSPAKKQKLRIMTKPSADPSTEASTDRLTEETSPATVTTALSLSAPVDCLDKNEFEKVARLTKLQLPGTESQLREISQAIRLSG
jgi:hypothetical protein